MELMGEPGKLYSAFGGESARISSRRAVPSVSNTSSSSRTPPTRASSRLSSATHSGQAAKRRRRPAGGLHGPWSRQTLGYSEVLIDQVEDISQVYRLGHVATAPRARARSIR